MLFKKEASYGGYAKKVDKHI